MVILDESTSALDTHTEARLLQALEGFVRERTVLVIAHRLSMVLWAHRVVMLEQGRIVEAGTHQQLYAAGGHYRRLCDQQLRDAAARQPGPAVAPRADKVVRSLP